jgi:two-component system response regulator YesN
MYRLLIIDDEFITRKGIRTQINFDELGITQIEEADDGLNGLKLAKVFEPDIVISDIKMPRMDGVTFAFELKKTLPNCRVIFMSAYTELDYYRNAIKLNAVSYIEKPIDLEELNQSLINAIKDLRQYTNYKEIIETNKEVLKSQISTLIIEPNSRKEEIQQKSHTIFGFDIEKCSFITVLIRLYTLDQLNPHGQEISKQFLSSVLNKHLQPHPLEYVMHYKGNSAVITLIANREHPMALDYKRLMIVFQEIYMELKTEVKPMIAVGRRVHKLGEVPNSFHQAAVVSERLFFKRGDSLDYEQNSHKIEVFEPNQKMFDTFAECLEQSDEQRITLFIKQNIEIIRQYQNTQINTIREVFIRWFTVLEYYMKHNEETVNIIWNAIASMMTLDDLESYLLSNIHHYFERIKTQSSINNVAKKAQLYLQEQYMNQQLSVDYMANEFGVSSSYLSTVFKKEFDITLNKYVTMYRIEKAKEFLKVKQDKIEEIAQRVGYTDSDYFSKVFKKQVLCTPTEYRKKFL